MLWKLQLTPNNNKDQLWSNITSTTLSSGLPDYSPNDSPHSILHSDTDDIIYDHDIDKQPSPTNIDQFTMHLDNIGGDNSAAQIYEIHNQQMSSPSNMANHLEKLTVMIDLNGLNGINIEHVFKY